MNTTKAEKTVKELLLGKCWEYFNDNFHKFSESNKIKIALAICTKDMPTQVDGNLVGETNIIINRMQEKADNGNNAITVSRPLPLQ